MCPYHTLNIFKSTWPFVEKFAPFCDTVVYQHQHRTTRVLFTKVIIFQMDFLDSLKDENGVVKICAPMVRYSKLPFRLLVREYGCDLAFSPMIMAESFAVSQKARENEFSTSTRDKPLIVQFASNTVDQFVEASKIVSNYCNGVDLNCGCPQGWALREGIGASLIDKPEFISDLVRQTRNQCRDDLLVSIKIRIHSDYQKTIELCRQVESAGVHFISVHGRTKYQRAEPVNWEAVTAIKQSVQIPVIANGDIKSLDDVIRVKQETNVDGVMAARGLLENPAFYAGFSETPKECIESWIKFSLDTGTQFSCFHHHLSYMLERTLSRADRKFFNGLNSTSAVLHYLDKNFDIKYK